MISVAVVLGSVWAFAISKAVAVRGRPAATGVQTMLGSHGVVRADGLVFVNGELWHARPIGGVRLAEGETVRVAGVDGLTLEVTPEPGGEGLGQGAGA